MAFLLSHVLLEHRVLHMLAERVFHMAAGSFFKKTLISSLLLCHSYSSNETVAVLLLLRNKKRPIVAPRFSYSVLTNIRRDFSYVLGSVSAS